MLLKNQVAVVTGGSGLLGKAISKKLAQEGAKVAIHYYRRKEEASRLAREIQQAGGDCDIFSADIRDAAQVKAMAEAVQRRFQHIDILVNNAATVPPEVGMKGFFEHPWPDYERYIDTVLKGTYHCCQSFLPGMVRQKSGRVINIGTTAVHEINGHLNPYVTAKAGLLGMTRSLAEEFGKHQITVNQVAPGWIWPDEKKKPRPEDGKVFRDRSPLGNGLATPEDIAGAVVFFASDLAKAVTGAYLPVCAGQIKGAG